MDIVDLLAGLLELLNLGSSSGTDKPASVTSTPSGLGLFVIAVLVLELVFLVTSDFLDRHAASWGTTALYFLAFIPVAMTGLYGLFRLRVVDSFRFVDFIVFSLTIAMSCTMLLLLC